MGMTKNQLDLVRYVAANNLMKAKKAAFACCEEDTTKKNHYQIERYKGLLRSTEMNTMELPFNISAFATMEDLSDTFLEKRYYLTKEEKELFQLIKKMNDVSLQLMEKRIPYLNATLLYGESGVGKTEFSKYVAFKLNMPYLYVNFSKMIDDLLGGTAKNLTALFSFINQQKCVVMLDEIDSLAVNRKYSDSSAGAEIARSTSCLLQLLDVVANDHVIIAATNLIESVDPAVKRRFTEKYEIRRLSAKDNEKFIMQYLEDTGFMCDEESVKKYAAKNYSQSEIMTHMIRCIANALINKEKFIVL